MILPLKFFFDENIGFPLYTGISCLLKLATDRNLQTTHLQDSLRSGLRDEDWIPKLKDEGWIVISADRGSRGSRSKGKSLPLVCRDNRITHVLISGSLHNRKQVEKACAILHVRDHLFELDSEPPGSCFLLKAGNSPSTFRLEKKTIKGAIRPNTVMCTVHATLPLMRQPMLEYPELTEQDKIDILAEKILGTPRPTEEPPAPTKDDLEQKFRISVASGKPIFEEVNED